MFFVVCHVHVSVRSHRRRYDGLFRKCLGQAQSLDKFDAQVVWRNCMILRIFGKDTYAVAVDVRTGQEGLAHTPGSFCAYPRGGS